MGEAKIFGETILKMYSGANLLAHYLNKKSFHYKKGDYEKLGPYSLVLDCIVCNMQAKNKYLKQNN